MKLTKQSKYFSFYSFIFITIIELFSSCSIQKNSAVSEEKWYKLLPACPCENPDQFSIKLNDGWAKEKSKSEMGFLQKFFAGKKDFTFFHPGAVASFRSYPYTLTRIDGKKFKSGQQCAYDKNGKLISVGPAAGTPDKFSPAMGENKKGLLKVNIFLVSKHIKYDARPWKKLNSQEYSTHWPPDKGMNCE